MNRRSLVSCPRPGWLSLFVLIALLVPGLARSQEIVINEIMARNSTNAPLVNFPEYFPDYIELYNTTAGDIDLAAGQWTLSNKKSPHTDDFKDFFFFPAGTVIPAESYLLVFMDNDTNFPGIHTTFTVSGTNVTFTLAGNGDRIQLYKNHDFLVDSNRFGFQIENLSIGRIPDGSGPFTLTLATPAGQDTNYVDYVPNTAATFVPSPSVSNEFTLKINEWMATNSAGADKDWFEIYNPDTNIVSVSGLVFVDKISNLNDGTRSRPVPANAYIPPLGWVRFYASDNRGIDANHDEVGFSISSSSGDEIFMFANDKSTLIDHVISTLIQKRDKTEGRVPDGGDTIIALSNPSPEDSNFGPIPEIAINEVLTHTDPPLEDAIELVNLTGTTQDISHWWISNNRNSPKKYRIPPNTSIPPHGFKVFYEYQFNSSNTAAIPFTLNSANGDECYIFKGNSAGKLTGFRRGIDFGPSANGVSFGRYVTSETNVDIVALSDLSFGTSVRASDPQNFLNLFRTGAGASNPIPRIGPLVINEIQYNPIPFISGTNIIDDSFDEFVEIQNITGSTVPLFDPNIYRADRAYPNLGLSQGEIYADGRTNTWRLRGGISFNFPQNISLAPGQFLLVVNFDPTNGPALNAFTNYPPYRALVALVPGQVRLFGPYKGKLSNGGATVEILRPDVPQGPIHPDFRLVPYITTDKVTYNDTAPWPVDADGAGKSLQRISAYEYGNDPINWNAVTPTPGRFNTPSGVEPPSISTQPRDAAAFVGRAASITVTARGGQLTYQWLFNGTNLPGRTTARLDLANLSTNQGGPYQVIITNVAGSVTSRVATLTVTESKPDTTRPTVSITSPTAPVSTDEVIIVRGRADDNVGISSVFYSVNGGAFLPAYGSVTYSVWDTSTNPVTLTVGTNLVRAYSQDHADNKSLTNSRSYFLSARTPLTLATNGGIVKGATNGQLLEVGRNFLLTALPRPGFVFSNWIVIDNLSQSVFTQPTLTYMMASNLAITANFVTNPYGRIAGQYNGLFYDNLTGIEHGSSGFFTLTATERGTYTASLLTGGLKLAAAGRLTADGQAGNVILRKGASTLTVDWHVALDGSDTVTGTVSDGSTWLATLGGDRAIFTKTNPCPLAGKYTLLLPGLPGDTFVPGGTSYGTVGVDSNGVATLKGFLSDKTGAAQKVPLSKNGEWPLYIPLYSGKGSLLSWVAFTNRVNDDFHGLLNWSKPALPAAKYYPLGFTTNENTLVGARYAPPVGVTNKILQLTDATLTLGGVNLVQNYTNDLVLGLGGKVTNGGPNTTTLTFTPATGLFKGSLTPTNARAIAFAGAVLQKGTNAAGFSLGTNHSARASLQAAP